MDVAYDHIQEEVLSPDEETAQRSKQQQEHGNDLNTEFRDAYKAFSSSPWGARLGGLWGTVKKQSEVYYEEAQRQLPAASEQALKGFAGLQQSIASRTRGLSFNQDAPGPSDAAAGEKAIQSEPQPEPAPHPARPESLPADIVKEATSMVSRFRSEAAKRLRDIEKAEDAADEALLRFGANIKNFLRDAVTVTGHSEGGATNSDGTPKLLFESRDFEGKRVIHTTRFDAQLHVIHSTAGSFEKDPASGEYEAWAQHFDVEKETGAIAKDLEQYEELRRTMEMLVPEKVEYAEFWKRYYFLRHVVETEEARRKELLRGAAANPEEDISWDDDDENDDEDDQSTTPNPTANPEIKMTTPPPSTIDNPTPAQQTKSSIPGGSSEESDRLKPTAEGRRSHDQQSHADSESSYDLISGATSNAPGSPKEDKDGGGEVRRKAQVTIAKEDSDGEDWE